MGWVESGWCSEGSGWMERGWWVVGGAGQKWCKVSRSAGEEHTFFISRVAHFSLRFLRKYATFKGPCRFMHVCVSEYGSKFVCVGVGVGMGVGVWKAMINEPLAFIFVSVSFHLGSRSLPRNRCLLIFQPASQPASLPASQPASQTSENYIFRENPSERALLVHLSAHRWR